MVPRLIVVAGIVAAACAAGFATASSPAATQANRCGLASYKSLHGHVSMTYNESASGEIPGANKSVTILFNRQATSVPVHLHRLKANPRLPGYYFYTGGSSGGSFTVNDASTGADEGTMTASGPSLPFIAGLGGHAGPCLYQLSVSFRIRAAATGDAAVGYSSYIGSTFTTPRSKKLSGSTVVPGAGDCDITYGSAGCVGFSGGWTTKFVMLKRCGATSAGQCQSLDDTDFGDATISWSLSPGP
jgi:hypothetical protein